MIERSLEKVAKGTNHIAGLMVIALMVLQVIIVVLRYVFSLGITWSQDLMVYLFMVSSVLPLILVVLVNDNVRVDVFFQDYSPALKSRMDRFALFILLLPVSIFTVYASIPTVVNSWKLLETSPTFGGLPGYFILKTILMVMFAGLAVCSLVLLKRPIPWAYEDDSITESVPQENVS